VSRSLGAAGIRLVLLDIEGTTTPLSFVHDVLFPYARDRVAQWFRERRPTDPERLEIVEGLRREPDADPALADTDTDAIVAFVQKLIDQDRKSGPLKTLQGKIWQSGYEQGELRSEVYDDVLPALRRWTTAGIAVGIYSSGSVLAQKLLFAHSNAGDLTLFLRWHFDTSAGPKRESSSYRRIADILNLQPERMLFVSDVTQELDAAKDAGLQTLLCVRPPATPPASAQYPSIQTFDEIVP
jgi:enolase-phosphatase E1